MLVPHPHWLGLDVGALAGTRTAFPMCHRRRRGIDFSSRTFAANAKLHAYGHIVVLSMVWHHFGDGTQKFWSFNATYSAYLDLEAALITSRSYPNSLQ